MTTIENQEELRLKVQVGLKLAYQRLLAFKKAKNSVLVVMHDGKIVKIKPE